MTRLWISTLCLLFLSCPALVSAQQVESPAKPGQPEKAQADIPDAIVKKVDPSVVAIQHERAGGSGFVISKDGYIMTNGHVVRGDDKEDPLEPAKLITVIMNDERKYRAQVLGFCMNPDVALIKIEPEGDLQPVEFADSEHVQVGQKCFAVGTPLGLKRTFTKGILSNVDRTDLGTFTKVFQTDAAINPGNSGGPLFDREGRVLGLNTYGSSGANNLGFTIPIHVAKVVKDHIMKQGRFIRSDLPTFFSGEIYDELARALKIDKGILVHYVMSGSLADEAGLKAGDIIIKIDGKACSAKTKAEMLDHEWALTILKPGTKVVFSVLRGPAGKRKEHRIALVTEEADPIIKTRRWAGEIVTRKYSSLGLDYKQLVTLHRFYYGLDDVEGVMVSGAASGSPAGKSGLRSSDIITHVNGHAVNGVEGFEDELEKCLSVKQKSIDITYRRQKATITTAINPYYDLKGKRITLVVPPMSSEYLELVLRDLVTDGADVTVATISGKAPNVKVTAGVEVGKLATIKGADYDVVFIMGGAGVPALREQGDARRVVKEAHGEEKILAAIGAASLIIVSADEELLETKITTSEDVSSEALKLKAHYTGKKVEKDGSVITTTGYDRATVRDFMKALRLMVRNS